MEDLSSPSLTMHSLAPGGKRTARLCVEGESRNYSVRNATRLTIDRVEEFESRYLRAAPVLAALLSASDKGVMSDADGKTVVQYVFGLPDGSTRSFSVEVGPDRVDSGPAEPPPWAALDFHKCPHCPLDVAMIT